MSKIIKQDSNGVKPLLAVGEFGYDNYPEGGDIGRVYVGNGSENIPQAKKAEVVAVDGKVNTHVARNDNPHSVTKTQVGLSNVDNTSDANKPVSTSTQNALNLKQNVLVSGSNIKTIEGQSIVGSGNIDLTKTDVGLSNVDNTADSAKVVASAGKWTTARTLLLTGGITGSVSIDGSDNASIVTTIAANSVALGTDTTGNYVAGTTAGAGVTVSGTPGEGWSPTIALTDVGTVGTYTKVTTNSKGQITVGDTLVAADIPNLDASKITAGTLPVLRGGTGVTTVTGTGSVVLNTSPALVTPNIGIATGTSFNSITGLASVKPIIAGVAAEGTSTQTARQDHVHPEQTSVSGNAGSATKLATARTINGAAFDGSANISVGLDSQSAVLATALTLDAIHKNRVLLCNGTFNITLPTAGTLKSGDLFIISNIGTGTLSLVTNGNYTDLSRLKVLAGEVLILQSDGGTFYRFVSRSKDFASNISTNGYTYLPNGLIMQWGTAPNISVANSYEVITTPIVFPNECLFACGSSVSIGSFGGAGKAGTTSVSVWGNSAGTVINYIAIGY